jgi:hypothetical protein
MRTMMSSHLRKRWSVAALVAVAAALLSPRASAQPDPFTDYEAMKTGKSVAPPDLPPPPQADRPKSKDPMIETEPWKWSVGARGALSYTGISNATLVGVNQSNTTLFVRLTPAVGLMVHKQVLVSASVGLLAKNLTREDGRDATEFAGLVEFSGNYIIPLTPRFAFMPGLGIGPYLGSSDRRIALPDGRTVNESTSTFGISMAGYLTIGYQLSQLLELRTGLSIYGLFQSEHVESANQDLASSAVHVGLPIEMHFHFQ